MESWNEMKEKAVKRLELLNSVSEMKNDDYLQYQKSMEEFYISFFENQELFVEAFQLLKAGNFEKAREILLKSNPDESIQKYADAIKIIGFTRGEKAIVFSMNTRWKADFMNLKQRLGMEPVRFRFSPTQHDSLAQSPGRYSYFIDSDKNWWRCMWKNELENSLFTIKENEPAIVVQNKLTFPLSSIHGQDLPEGVYEIQINTALPSKNEAVKLDLFHQITKETTPATDVLFHDNKIVFKTGISGKTELIISVENKELRIENIVIAKI